MEAAESNEARAFAVNERGARTVAEAAARHGLGLVHVSTDFVFDGAKTGPYTEDDTPNPLSVYGRSKLAGDRAVWAACPDALVVRTAWVYGPGGSNFPSKILAAARTRDEVRVVTDEVGSPTYSADLARGILELWLRGGRGLFNLAGSGSCSRFELAQEVIAAAGLPARVVPVASGTFPTKAARPKNSVLCLDKARGLGVEMPPWQDSVRAYVRTHLLQAVGE